MQITRELAFIRRVDGVDRQNEGQWQGRGFKESLGPRTRDTQQGGVSEEIQSHSVRGRSLF